MAGDWIKMRVDLALDPAVIGIATECQIDEDLVVGKLHKLWSWADQQTENGCAVSATVSWLERYIGVTGFAKAMENAGWLTISEKSFSIPKFQRHNGKTGKTRALALKRMQRIRCAASATKASPDNREDIDKKKKKKKKKAPAPQLEQSGPLLLTFPCHGKIASWALTQSQADDWHSVYPAVDILDEAKRALAWLHANGFKTARGMPRFLNGWLSRATDRTPRRARPTRQTHTQTAADIQRLLEL